MGACQRCFFPGGLDSSTVGPAAFLLFTPLLYTALLMLVCIFALSSTSAVVFASVLGIFTYLSILMVLYYLMRLLLFHRLRWTRFSLLTHMALALLCIATLYAAQIPFASSTQKAYQLWKAVTPYVNITTTEQFNSQLSESLSKENDLPYVLLNDGIYLMQLAIAVPLLNNSLQTLNTQQTTANFRQQHHKPIEQHQTTHAVDSSADSALIHMEHSLSSVPSFALRMTSNTPAAASANGTAAPTSTPAPTVTSATASTWIYAVPIIPYDAYWDKVMRSNGSLFLTVWSVSFVDTASIPPYQSACSDTNTSSLIVAGAPVSACSVFNGGTFNPQEGQLIFAGAATASAMSSISLSDLPSDARNVLGAIYGTLNHSKFSYALPPSWQALSALTAEDLYSSYNWQYNVAYDSAIALALAFDIWVIVLMPIIGYALNVHSCTQHGMSTQRADHFASTNNTAETDRLVQPNGNMAQLQLPTANSDPMTANTKAQPGIEMVQLQ